ncbi:MAG TPA: TIGR03067 domain-containing protein [Urbifossiella sp.]|nr:TIGR03067 domain-containing protein [Urbifossiella sp.]
MRTASLSIAALAAGFAGLATLSGQPPAGAKADTAESAELAKFRGEWEFWKLDLPPGEPDDAVPPGLLKAVRLSVHGDRLTASLHSSSRGVRPNVKHALIKLDPAKSPAQIDLTHATDTFVPLRTRPTAGKSREPLLNVTPGIYKFETDTLVVAVPTLPEGGRPTEFKTIAPKNPTGTRAEQAGVALAYLVRVTK